MHTTLLRRIAAIYLLALSASLTALASAEDWRSQWRRVLPDVPIPADVTEAEEVFWTYYVESDARARTCDGIVRMLTSEFKRLVSTGETTAASGHMVTEVIDHCIGIKAGGMAQQALLSSLIDAGTAEFMAIVSRVQDGEAVSLSSEELEQIRYRLERRTAHLARWRKERQRLLQ